MGGRNFGDARLDSLESDLIAANPALAEAEARFRQAQALVRQQRAQYFPTVTATASATRTHPPSGSRVDLASGTITDYSLGATSAWEADLWGRIRQTVASGTASAQAAAGDVESARLSLSAELASDYFQLRSADAELALFDQTIDVYQRAATLDAESYNAGIVSRADVEQADTQLASAQAQAVDVRAARAARARDCRTHRRTSCEPVAAAPLAGEPPPVPADVPSRLLQQRPDIGAAERRVAAANADVGVASAAFFPALTLTGDAGLQATHLAQWLAWPMRFWSVGPGSGTDPVRCGRATRGQGAGRRKLRRHGGCLSRDGAVGLAGC